jgi:hypothetical protein
MPNGRINNIIELAAFETLEKDLNRVKLIRKDEQIAVHSDIGILGSNLTRGMEVHVFQCFHCSV